MAKELHQSSGEVRFVVIEGIDQDLTRVTYARSTDLNQTFQIARRWKVMMDNLNDTGIYRGLFIEDPHYPATKPMEEDDTFDFNDLRIPLKYYNL